MFFCTNCGVRHDGNACFCTNCGERICTATHDRQQNPVAAQEPTLQSGQDLQTSLPIFPDNDHAEIVQDRQNARNSKILGILSIGTSLTVIGGAILGALAIIQARLAGKKKQPAPAGLLPASSGCAFLSLLRFA